MSQIIQSPREYFETYVLPSYFDYLAKPDDLRLAMNVATCAYSLSEWIWKTYSTIDSKRVFQQKSLKDFRTFLNVNECLDFLSKKSENDFHILADIVDGYKHLHLTHGKGLVSSAPAVSAGPSRYGEFRWGEGTWGHNNVRVQLDQGTPRVFSSIIRNVIEMWQRLFSTLYV